VIDQKASTCAVEIVNSLIDLEKTNSNLAEVPDSSGKDTTASHSSKLLALSPREQEIVRLVAKGLPNKTIAAILDISPWTVATHLRRVFGKLGVRSRAAMIASLIDHIH